MGPFKGKGASEQTLFRNILDRIEEGDVVLGDVLFSDYFLLAKLIKCGVAGVFNQFCARQSTTDFRKGNNLGCKDHLIRHKKPQKKSEWMTEKYYMAAPKTITIR